MTKDEALKLALEALEAHADIGIKSDKAINAIKEALAQPDYRAVKTYHEGKPVYVAQPEQPKYRRGSRVICLETEEYCVIHISGTDRQWVKFPDSHIGVYTNEQVAELFELLPKEQPQPEQNLNCKSVQARLATAWGYVKAQLQQEPVAWWDGKESVVFAHDQIYTPNWTDYWTNPLYTVASPCPTCEALARTVMLDQTSHDAAPPQSQQGPVATVTSESGNTDLLMSWWHEPALPVGTKLYISPPQHPWVGLTDEDLKLLSAEWRIVYGAWMDDFAQDIEAKLKEKNT